MATDKQIENDQNTTDIDIKYTEEVFKPVLNYFKNILEKLDGKSETYQNIRLKQKAINDYHSKLKQNAIIGINVIPEFQVAQMSSSEKTSVYLKFDRYNAYHKDSINQALQDKANEISKETARCPNESKIKIQYGIRHFQHLNNNEMEQAKLSKSFIPLGDIEGKLFEKVIEYSDYTQEKKSDTSNPIHFHLNTEGIAEIPCVVGKEYYIQIDSLKSDEKIQKWLDGYHFMINELSEFLEHEWKTVHLPRWKANRDEGDFFWVGVNDGISDIPTIKAIDNELNQYLGSSNHRNGIPPNGIRTGPKLFFNAVIDTVQNIATNLTQEQEKNYSFYLQDKIHMYIQECFLLYWQELYSPADKAYLAGKELTEFFADVAAFIIEFYLGGKAIDLIVKYSAKFGYAITSTFVEKDLILLANAASKLILPTKMAQGLACRFAAWSLKREINSSARLFSEINTTYANGSLSFTASYSYVIRNDVSAYVEKLESTLFSNIPPGNLGKIKVDATKPTLNLDPVSMLTGEELLTLVDDTVFSQFPFVWQRLYRTSAVEFNSGLGYGWSHSLCHTLSFNDDNQVIWQNHENNLITFPLPTESSPDITNLLSEAAIFLGQEPNHYLVSSEFGIYHFKRDSDNISTARLVAISDKYGHQHNVIYDAEHKLIALELAGGVKRIELTYLEQMPSLITEVSELTRKSVTQEWQFLRQIMHYDYNEQQELIAATNALNHTEQYIYGEGHLIAQRKMAGGATFNWQWQGEGKAAVCHRQITNLNGIESRYEWDAKSRKSIAYQSDGTTLTYVHNEQGKLISETNASGQTTIYEYNENGQMTKQTDALGGQTQYFYNKFNKLEAIHTPDGQSTSYYWWGEQISEVMKGKRNWQFRHNEYGDRIEEISPEGKKTQYQYNEDGQCIAVIYPDDTKLTQAWNAQGQRTQTTYPDGRSEHYTYDAQGRISTVTDGQNQAVSYGYDGLGQITKVTYPNKTTREYRYNAYGKVTWFKDESGKVTEYEYASPLHLMTEKRLPNGDRLKFSYDNIHLQVSEIENQKGEVYHLSYTPTGQLSEEIGFDGIKTTYHYDNAGHLVEKLEYGNTPDAEPLVTTYQRDIAGRLAARVFADGVTEQYEYDEYGQLKKVKDGHNVLVWEYNLDGQLTAEHQNWATIRHRYDKTSGLLNGTKLPDGQWLEYHHRNGQLRGITLDGQSLMGMHYDVLGRERERRQGNGLINRYGYDELGKLTSHQIYRGFDIELDEAPQPVWQQQYQYESDGQLAQINGNQARSYRYDKLVQLQTVSYPQSNREQHHAEKVELFSYDATGNKINETQSLAKFEANVSQGNRLLFFSDKHFEYDRFGNLTKEKRGKNQSLVTHYEYDCRHRLIKVIKPSGQTITYTYDPFNRRTSKTVNCKTTEFLWQGNKLIAETDNDKHWQSYLYEPDSYHPLALVQGNAQQGKTKLYWYQNDQLGTPTRLTDGFGETVYECQYNAYGQIIDETLHQEGNTRQLPDNPLRFQGQYYDEETGLHYNLNRYYDPFIGRYITQDPIKLTGGLNFYAYVDGNPINWIDPLGYFRGLDRASGQKYAKTILEGGTGDAFAGHGYYRFGDGEIIVPPGTAITLPKEGIKITDITGQLIEKGDWNSLIKLAKTNARVEKDIEGMTTWLPGAKIPNYILDKPENLIIYSNSKVVSQPTHLQILLKPDMKCVLWAACTEYLR